jgi:predicted RNase H-like HicB family nuclease
MRSPSVAKTFDFTVVLAPQDQGGFAVSVPALAGVVTEGELCHGS